MEGLNDVSRRQQAWLEAQHRKAAAAADEIAALLESDAKANAPFTDRTGNLRNSIQGTGEQVRADLYRVVLSAGMEYAIFVETIRGGHYAYLWPTMLRNEARIKAIWRERLRA